MTVMYFCQKINNKNHQCYIVVVLIKKKLSKSHCSHFFEEGGILTKLGGGGVHFDKYSYFYQKVISSEFLSNFRTLVDII